MTRRILMMFALLAVIAVVLGFYALHLKRKVARDARPQRNSSWQWHLQATDRLSR